VRFSLPEAEARLRERECAGSDRANAIKCASPFAMVIATFVVTAEQISPKASSIGSSLHGDSGAAPRRY
jgi:hypothetical protein